MLSPKCPRETGSLDFADTGLGQVWFLPVCGLSCSRAGLCGVRERAALVGGLRNGKLEHAVAKMEADEVQFDNPIHVRDGAADNHGR